MLTKSIRYAAISKRTFPAKTYPMFGKYWDQSKDVPWLISSRMYPSLRRVLGSISEQASACTRSRELRSARNGDTLEFDNNIKIVNVPKKLYKFKVELNSS